MKNKLITIIFILLTVGLTVFIFFNSLTVGTESAKQSGYFVNIVSGIAGKFNITVERDTLSLIIRKLGHFSEYFALAVAASCAVISGLKKKIWIAVSPVYCFIVAVCDEFIMQSITEGRSPQWTDVLIDLGGAVLATLAVSAAASFIKSKKTRNGKRKTKRHMRS